MIESFVDLTYRGLALGRRVKLTSVGAGTGYLEMPAPMPVGTSIAIATDDGLTLVAVVRAIHEQVGGSEQAPGMLVAPALDDAAHAAWWTARIAPAPEPAAPPAILTVRPRSHTIPQPLVTAQLADEPAGGRTIAMMAVVPDVEPEQGGATQVMDAVDPALLAQLLGGGGGGGPAVLDDGRATSVMDAIDPAALGLEVGASGGFPVTDDEVDAEGDPAPGSARKPATSAAKKPRKKKPK